MDNTYHSYGLISGTAHPELSQQIAKHLDVPLIAAEIGKFSNGETSVVISESIRSKDIYLIQPICPPSPNDNLMELLILVDAVKRASASRVTTVIPCFGYSRQSKKHKSRTPITAKLVANLLETSGVDRVITIDLHSSQIQGFFDCPVDNLYVENLIVKYIKKRIPGEWVVVAPGVGGVKRAKGICDILDADFALLHKQTKLRVREDQFNHFHRSVSPLSNGSERTSPNLAVQKSPSLDQIAETYSNPKEDGVPPSSSSSSSSTPTYPSIPPTTTIAQTIFRPQPRIGLLSGLDVTDHTRLFSPVEYSRSPSPQLFLSDPKQMILVGSVRDKVAIIIDDIADTCETLELATKTLLEYGAREVHALVTHGMLSGNAKERIYSLDGLKQLVITDSIPQDIDKNGRIKVMSVAPLLAEAIRRTYHGENVEGLFTK
eukprot:TRINITY_DN4035_c0_g1_i2.p1 TRINITY_DN4035_c0_g1~~TRINITY_DN4035_c0_g1_i2.p1  ORF type:complete len:432 (-),score=42.11 TRINITY_DN4035_c0_g1_i2:200-1495(-)